MATLKVVPVSIGQVYWSVSVGGVVVAKGTEASDDLAHVAGMCALIEAATSEDW